ncbi:MAG: hypothetical protein ACO3XO_07735 [Bdellovibrionota bacterium]
MGEYSYPDPGVTILRYMEQLRSPRYEDPSAAKELIGGLCETLFRFRIPANPSPDVASRVVEGLRQVLEVENTDLLVHAAAAVPKVAPYAEALVPRLKELANVHGLDGTLSRDLLPAAAFSALGSIHSNESSVFLFGTLQEIVENPHHPILKSETLTRNFFTALGLQGEYLQRAIPYLEQLLEGYGGNSVRLIAVEDALTKIVRATALLSSEWAELAVPKDLYHEFSDFQALTANGIVLDIDQPAGSKLYDERLKFQILDHRSECRVRIFAGRNEGEAIIMFTSDEQSYGVSPTQGIEILANGVGSLFGIDTTKATFLEHHTYGKSGRPYRIAESPDVSEVLFQATKSGELNTPRWNQLKDPYAELSWRFNITDRL